MAILLQCYSVRGMNVVAGMNISIRFLICLMWYLLPGRFCGYCGGTASQGRQNGRGKGHRQKDDSLSVACCTFIAPVGAGHRTAVSTALQYQCPVQGIREIFYYGDSRVYAAECLFACRLFYPAFRREDDSYLFL